jgi:hypothetical protein
MGVDVDETILHVLASRMVDRVVVEDAAQPAIAAMLVGHDAGARRDVLAKPALDGRGAGIGNFAGAKLAASHQHLAMSVDDL